MKLGSGDGCSTLEQVTRYSSYSSERPVKTFVSFDGTRIAYHDEGERPAVKTDVANQKVDRLLEEIPTARSGECDGDHHSAPYQPTFQQAVVQFFEEEWRRRRVVNV